MIREQGVVDQVLNAIVVQAKPDDIPGHLAVDMSGARDRPHDHGRPTSTCPPGVTTEVDPEEPVVIAQLTSLALAEEEEGEEGEEGAEGEVAEGEGGESAEGEGGAAADESGE